MHIRETKSSWVEKNSAESEEYLRELEGSWFEQKILCFEWKELGKSFV